MYEVYKLFITQKLRTTLHDKMGCGLKDHENSDSKPNDGMRTHSNAITRL